MLIWNYLLNQHHQLFFVHRPSIWFFTVILESIAAAQTCTRMPMILSGRQIAGSSNSLPWVSNSLAHLTRISAAPLPLGWYAVAVRCSFPNSLVKVFIMSFTKAVPLSDCIRLGNTNSVNTPMRPCNPSQAAGTWTRYKCPPLCYDFIQVNL